VPTDTPAPPQDEGRGDSWLPLASEIAGSHSGKAGSPLRESNRMRPGGERPVLWVGDGEQRPLIGDAAQRVVATAGEGETRSDDEVPDRARDEDLGRLGERCHARRDTRWGSGGRRAPVRNSSISANIASVSPSQRTRSSVGGWPCLVLASAPQIAAKALCEVIAHSSAPGDARTPFIGHRRPPGSWMCRRAARPPAGRGMNG
jgi:hypothetical protein